LVARPADASLVVTTLLIPSSSGNARWSSRRAAVGHLAIRCVRDDDSQPAGAGTALKDR
jgi:hypothetical protein